MSETEPTVERETEKAVLLKWATEYGVIKSWIPKSCILTGAETEAPVVRRSSGLEYNENLVKFAKANGVKGVRVGMKTMTLIEKIKAAGLEVPARA